MEDFAMYSQIQQAKKQGFSKNATAKKLSVNWRTVNQYWDMSEEEYAQMQRSQKKSRISLHEQVIVNWIKQHEIISAAQIQDWLLEQYDEQYNPRTVRRYVSEIREKYHLPKQKETREFEAIPELGPGFQMQADFGFFHARRQSRRAQKLYFVVFILAHSRFKCVYWQTKHFTTQDFVRSLESCFQDIGGRPQQLVIDQDSLMVSDENYGDILFTKDFESCKNRHHLQLYVCRKNDPQTKGMVESGVKFVKYNFARNRTFISLRQWNQDCAAWLERTGNGKIHETTKKIPAEVFLVEKTHLRPVILNTSLESCEDMVTTPVQKNNTIRYKGNRYSLPFGTYTQHSHVDVYDKEGTLQICLPDGSQLVEVPLASGKGEFIANRNHKRNNQEKIEELRSQVLHQLGDTRTTRNFLDRIKKSKPRYMRDQLSLILTVIHKHSGQVIRNALLSCDREKSNAAVDFRDYANMHARQMSFDQWEEMEPAEPTPQPLSLPDFPKVTQHAPDVYQQLMDKGDD